MLNHHLIFQDDQNTGAFGLLHFRTERRQKRSDISPLDVPTHWSLEDQFQRFLMLTLHGNMVPIIGATVNWPACQQAWFICALSG